MRCFLQYHNVEKLGWVPLDERPFVQTDLSIATRKPAARGAAGAAVFVIASLGRPRRYYLWERFVAERVTAAGEDFCVSGTGRQLVPPAALRGEAFDAFRWACANFIGFRRIDGLPYAAALAALAEAPDDYEAAERFCTSLLDDLPGGDGHFHRGVVRLRLGRRLDAIEDFVAALRRGTEYAAATKQALREAVERL